MNGPPSRLASLGSVERERHAAIMDTSWDRWRPELRRHVALTPGARQHPDRLPEAVADWIASRRPYTPPGGAR